MAKKPEIRLPGQAAVVAGFRHVSWFTVDGKIESLDKRETVERLLGGARPFVCHASAIARRLELESFAAFDLLELFAFVRPAQFVLPTPKGLAESLGLTLPSSIEAESVTLPSAARELLGELALLAVHDADHARDVVGLACSMKDAGWSWGAAVLSALGMPKGTGTGERPEISRFWLQLSEWQEGPIAATSGHYPINAKEAEIRLNELLGPGSEKRSGQQDYAGTCVNAFAPRNRQEEPNLVLAEAGTGIGKTLGYIASARLWAERNDGTVWISTYTRNLQRQLDAELDRLCPAPADKKARIVIRKGRENYLCILNLADAFSRTPSKDEEIIVLGLVARWVMATRDGDMIGGDFPAWLIDLFGTRLTTNLTDTRGECVYSACDHYRRCFIEHTVRRARRADLVVANHALVMVHAALGGGEEGTLPTRYVFDEGHQIFDAADNAFAAHLSCRETEDLRRWIIGAEKRSRRRGRGLHVRMADIIVDNEEAKQSMNDALVAARILPGNGWRERIFGGKPVGIAEAFFVLVHQQVLARTPNTDTPYDLETAIHPVVPGLLDAAI